jgi:hypothetical protein
LLTVKKYMGCTLDMKRLQNTTTSHLGRKYHNNKHFFILHVLKGVIIVQRRCNLARTAEQLTAGWFQIWSKQWNKVIDCCIWYTREGPARFKHTLLIWPTRMSTLPNSE